MYSASPRDSTLRANNEKGIKCSLKSSSSASWAPNLMSSVSVFIFLTLVQGTWSAVAIGLCLCSNWQAQSTKDHQARHDGLTVSLAQLLPLTVMFRPAYKHH